MPRVSKWYLDVITPDGEAAIVYWSSLVIGGLPLHAASVLHAPIGGPVTQRTRLVGRRVPFPLASETSIHCELPRLGVAASIKPLTPGCERTLLAEVRVQIDWRCLAPCADVEMHLDGRTIRGTGYLERITLDLPSWHMPMTELRWGRAHVQRAVSPPNAPAQASSAPASSPSAHHHRAAIDAPNRDHDSLVWIEWRGQHPLSLAWLNGQPVPLTRLDDTRVHAGPLSLTLEPVRTLRDGTLKAAALARAPVLRSLLPSQLLAAHETKWLSRAAPISPPCHATADHPVSTDSGHTHGWAIHERVLFPDRRR